VAKLAKQAVLAGLKGVAWVDKMADMVREFDVFLSHASEDKPRVQLLHNSLSNAGIRAFFDVSEIKWGDSIVEKVNHGLLRSHFFAPFLTDTFAKKGWANKELNAAISMNISQQGRILPIIDENFVVEKNYPILTETLYKTWPADEAKWEPFISEVTDELVSLVAKLDTGKGT